MKRTFYRIYLKSWTFAFSILKRLRYASSLLRKEDDAFIQSISRIIWIIEVPSRELLPKYCAAKEIHHKSGLPSIFIQKHAYHRLPRNLIENALVVHKSATSACLYTLFYTKRNGGSILLIPEEICTYEMSYDLSTIKSTINRACAPLIDCAITNKSTVLSNYLIENSIVPLEAYNPRLTYCAQATRLATDLFSRGNKHKKPVLLLMLSSGILNSKYGIEGETTIAKNVYPFLSEHQIKTYLEAQVASDQAQYSTFLRLLSDLQQARTTEAAFNILLRPHPNESHDSVAKYIGDYSVYLSDPDIPLSNLIGQTFLALTFRCTTTSEFNLNNIPVVDLALLSTSEITSLTNKIIALEADPCLQNRDSFSNEAFLDRLIHKAHLDFSIYTRNDDPSDEWLSDVVKCESNMTTLLLDNYLFPAYSNTSLCQLRDTLHESSIEATAKNDFLPSTARETWFNQNYFLSATPEQLCALSLAKIDNFTFLLQ